MDRCAPRQRPQFGENGQQPPLPADDPRFLVGGAPVIVHYETIDLPG
jgi:hypothetical protein